MDRIGLYIHIPFCKAKCYYCDFNSYGGMECLQDEYVNSVGDELEMRASLIRERGVKTVFIGGGTPTYLNLSALGKLLASVGKYISSPVEYTCEANPGTLSDEKLMMLKEYGVNRLSIGLQSWDNDMLRYLGRIHTREEFLKNYYAARDIGFDNINIDLMFSVPGQSLEIWDDTLKNTISLKPRHISCYGLMIEDGTAFGRLHDAGKLNEVDDELDREMYYLAVNRLSAAGYRRYEISNFAEPRYECAHNIIYWRTKPYLGIGAGAHSYIDGIRFSNETSPPEYIGAIGSGTLPVVETEKLTEDDMISEYMFMGLRMTDGISLDEFKRRFGADVRDIYKDEIEDLLKKGLIRIDGPKMSLTDRGTDISNQVFVELLR